METFAVIMELGIAHLCLITNYTTLLLEKVTLTIPAKKSTSQYEAKITKFYKLIMDAMVRHLRIEEMKCCILASPGFYKEAFFHFLTHTIASTNSDMSEFSAAIKKHKSKFILVHSSNGFLDALTQVLKDPLLRSKIQETKSLKETRSLNLFLETLRTKPDEAFYGVEAVQAALKMKAVKALLLSSTLLRSLDLETRLTYHKIANDFERKKSGCFISIVSRVHIYLCA